MDSDRELGLACRREAQYSGGRLLCTSRFASQRVGGVPPHKATDEVECGHVLCPCEAPTYYLLLTT